VASAGVRACDVVLKLDGDAELAVKFPDHVLGSSFQRGARVGVAVTAKGDGALGQFTKSLGAGVSIDEATCFDRAGKAVAQQGVSLR
jgi:hypothetical protein